MKNLPHVKRIILVAIAFGVYINTTHADSYFNLMKEFIANQKKIKTFLGSGTMRVQMKNSKGEILDEFTSAISIYIKTPDKCKLIFNGPVRNTIIQKNNMISIQSGDNDMIIKQPLTDEEDLLSVYFMRGAEEVIAHNTVESSEQVVVGDQTLYKFRVKEKATDRRVPKDMSMLHSDEKTDIYFNKKGLIMRTDILLDGKEISRTFLEYTEEKGIFLTKKITTSNFMDDQKIESVIEYSGVAVNTEISEDVFEF